VHQKCGCACVSACRRRAARPSTPPRCAPSVGAQSRALGGWVAGGPAVWVSCTRPASAASFGSEMTRHVAAPAPVYSESSVVRLGLVGGGPVKEEAQKFSVRLRENEDCVRSAGGSSPAAPPPADSWPSSQTAPSHNAGGTPDGPKARGTHTPIPSPGAWGTPTPIPPAC